MMLDIGLGGDGLVEMAKKAGFKDAQNLSTNQIVGEKIRGVIARSIALENVSKYLTAITGVALGSQKSFGQIQFTKPKTWKDTFVKSAKELWKGNDKNIFTKHAGKALAIGAGVSTMLAWLIPTIAFKTNPDTMKSKIDINKEIEVF